MPYDFGLNLPWRREQDIRTPPFVDPSISSQRTSIQSMQELPPLLSPEEDVDITIPENKSAAELRALIANRSQQKPAGTLRKIMGAVVGAYAPAIGQDIANPGARDFNNKATLLGKAAQLEDNDIGRQIETGKLLQTRKNQQQLRYQAQVDAGNRQQAARELDATRRDAAGEVVNSPEPYQIGARSEPLKLPLGPPDVSGMTLDGMGLPALPELKSPEPRSYRGVADVPLAPSSVGIRNPQPEGMTRATVPAGSVRVPSTSYDPAGTIRSKKTPETIAREKYEATTEETPQDILDVYPQSPKRMSQNSILGMRQAIVNNDNRTADRLAREAQAEAQRAFQATQNDLNRQNARAIATSKSTDQTPSGLSENALHSAAIDFLTSGVLPTGSGKDANANRTAVRNAAAELDSAANLSGNRGQYLADSRSMASLQKQADAVGAFEQAAGANLQAFIDSAKQLTDTGIPFINEIVRGGQRKIMGNSPQATADALRVAAYSEVAKVLSGSMGNVAMSDHQKKEAEAILSGDYTMAQFLDVAQAIKQDMARRIQGFNSQIQTINGRMNGQYNRLNPTTQNSGDPGRGDVLAPVSGGKQYQQTRQGQDGKKYGWSPGMSDWEVIP